MFYWLYERMLLSQIQVLPGHICFMLSGADLAADPEKCFEVTGWCSELNARPDLGASDRKPPAIKGLTFHISPLSPAELERSLPGNKKDLFGCPARAALWHDRGGFRNRS